MSTDLASTDAKIHIKNTLTGKKELFSPIVQGKVGMYVCGPTVYGEPHLGHARSAITFDVVFRYLTYLGYKVRYVRNITDVGHLEDELSGQGEDKVAKKARLEQLEPMEVAQRYTNLYRDMMATLNVSPPSIEPTATGHIPEQIAVIEKIIDKGMAYVAEGSVYLDVTAYAEQYHYGELSGRVLEELMAGSRDLEGQKEKKHPADFALWKKADASHIMQWTSPWGQGFPGWHIECTAMSSKYLGVPFDIHGGGMDLKFPHHEAEIAQSYAAFGTPPVNYWMHNNMMTLDGQKMAKSKGNFISLGQMFSGKHPLLKQAYHPMTVRFLMLQAHYGSPIDFSNKALKAAEVACNKLLKGLSLIQELKTEESQEINSSLSEQVLEKCQTCFDKMNDDFNTAETIACLFELLSIAHKLAQGAHTISEKALSTLKSTYQGFLVEVLGIRQEANAESQILPEVMDILSDLRQEARAKKDFALSDYIRDRLTKLGIQINDSKEKTTYDL
ncbi:MAG TPA: cysteine--tRNA ligase [Cytophagales bacterium]|nr:cysteine--tRNA ligase [Cytophagales bacterium]HAA20561.1 cysteine--tRNA ligase [Cytophagales bacterium]HAP65188.1 cysteine--tRNA ligase [Cytophagales bacterium]